MWLWKAGTLVVYLAVMVGVFFTVKFLVQNIGLWTGLAIGLAGLGAAYLMDKSGKFTVL